MEIKIRKSDKINIVDIEGRVDIDASAIIEIIGWLVKNHKVNILLNFDKVSLVDYSGISILAIAYKNVINHKGKLKLCNVQLHISELFKLVKLDSVFEIYQNENDALKTFFYESPLDKIQLRRRFKRLDIPIEVEFSSEHNYKKNNTKWRGGKLLNISGDGIYLYTKGLLPIGERVRLNIILEAKIKIEMKGVVVWLADKSIQPQSYPGMGLNFTKITKKDQDRILRFINKHIINRSSIR